MGQDNSTPLPPCPHFLPKNQHFNHKDPQTSTYIYSKPISEKKPGETPIYRNIENLQSLTQTPEKTMATLQDLILKCFIRYSR